LLDAALSAEQRALVRLYYDVGESHAEIAERLGITKQAVTQRFATIHKRIREALEKTFETEVKKDATTS
jgi:DNA-directed RNA polymerase specialized sigma24 family protein